MMKDFRRLIIGLAALTIGMAWSVTAHGQSAAGSAPSEQDALQLADLAKSAETLAGKHVAVKDCIVSELGKSGFQCRDGKGTTIAVDAGKLDVEALEKLRPACSSTRALPRCEATVAGTFRIGRTGEPRIEASGFGLSHPQLAYELPPIPDYLAREETVVSVAEIRIPERRFYGQTIAVYGCQLKAFGAYAAHCEFNAPETGETLRAFTVTGSVEDANWRRIYYLCAEHPGHNCSVSVKGDLQSSAIGLELKNALLIWPEAERAGAVPPVPTGTEFTEVEALFDAIARAGTTITVKDCLLGPPHSAKTVTEALECTVHRGRSYGGSIRVQAKALTAEDRKRLSSACLHRLDPLAYQLPCHAVVTGIVRVEHERYITLADASFQWTDPLDTRRSFPIENVMKNVEIDGRQMTSVDCRLGYLGPTRAFCFPPNEDRNRFPEPLARITGDFSVMDRARLVDLCPMIDGPLAPCLATVTGTFDVSRKAPEMKEVSIHWINAVQDVAAEKLPEDARSFTVRQLLIEANERAGQKLTVSGCHLRISGLGNSATVTCQSSPDWKKPSLRPFPIKELPEDDQRWLMTFCISDVSGAPEPKPACQADMTGTVGAPALYPSLNEIALVNWAERKTLPPYDPANLNGADLSLMGGKFANMKVTLRSCWLVHSKLGSSFDTTCWLPVAGLVKLESEEMRLDDRKRMVETCGKEFKTDQCIVDLTGTLLKDPKFSSYRIQDPVVTWR